MPRVAAGGAGGPRPPRSAFPESCGFPGQSASPWHGPRTPSQVPWVGRSPNVLGQSDGRRDGRCRDPVRSSPAPTGGRRWEMLCPGRSGTSPPARRHRPRPCCNISNELGRLSCGSSGVEDVQGVYEVLCVPGQRVPAGQQWSGARGVGLRGCCCSTRCSGRARGWCSLSGQRDGAGLQGNELLGSDHPNWELPPPP